jgi:hypothetical protein
MEPKMNSFRVLNTRAFLALVLAMTAPAASSAEPQGDKGSRRAVHADGGFHAGKGYHGGGVRRFSGGEAGYRGTFISGSVVGAVGFYDNGYYEDGPVAVVQNPGGGDAVAYCMRTYRSYDPQSGTYLGYDGQRHPCP